MVDQFVSLKNKWNVFAITNSRWRQQRDDRTALQCQVHKCGI